MYSTISFSDLVDPRQKLVTKMQKLNFGHVDYLTICDRQPVFKPPLQFVSTYRFGGDNSVRAERDLLDFQLKDHVCEMFSVFDHLGNAYVQSIRIENGLPVHMCVVEVMEDIINQ